MILFVKRQMYIFEIVKNLFEDYEIDYKVIVAGNCFIYVVFDDQFLGELFEAMYSLDSVSKRIIL